MQNKTTLETKLIHTGRDKRHTQGVVNPVIQRASSVIFENTAAKKYAAQHCTEQELFYGRRGTLTHFALQDLMVEMEGGAGCYLYPCGAAAVTHSILAFVQSGDHLLMSGAAYEPTQHFCRQILRKMQVETTFYDPMSGEKIADFIRPNTKVLFLESPSSLTMEVPDIPTIVKAARAVNPDIVIMIDNTWAAGILFKALDYGIDISIQAGTKYLVGHSDVMIGTAVANSRTWARLRDHSYLMGQMVDADSAYMTARGIRTLSVRLKQHESASIQIANWLKTRPEVKEVYHPALSDCLGHEFYLRDFSGSSGLFSFELHKCLTEAETAAFMDHFSLFSMAFSWGGFESLILCHNPQEIAKIRPNITRTLTGSLIRVHIGFENAEELIEDLARAFERIA